MEGEDYNKARAAANTENHSMHINYPSLDGKQIHEVHPVKFSGSPTDHSNKIALTPKEHARYTKFWRTIQRSAENQM